MTQFITYMDDHVGTVRIVSNREACVPDELKFIKF